MDEVPIDQIRPSPYQPRLTFDLEDIKGSIMRDGILVPLTVRKKDGYYELIDGERRWRVAKGLGYKTVPCTVVEADDESADRMVWKVNTLRKEYEPNEKAHHYREHERKGMSLRGIAENHDTSPHVVRAYLNVFKLPTEYQQMVWGRVIPIRNIQATEKLFNGVTRVTREKNPELFEILDRSAKEKHFGAEQIQEALKPYLAKFREEQIERAKEVLAEIEPEVGKPETPEELERTAEALRREAERRKTPEQKAEEKRLKLIDQARKSLNSTLNKIDGASKIIDVSSFRERFIELEKSLEQNPSDVREQLIALGKEVTNAKKQRQKEREEEKRKKREEEERRRLEEEMKKKFEEEKLRFEEEAKVKAKEGLLRDEAFVKQFIEREYSLMSKTMKIEDLEKELMQRLIASIPAEKKERAESIFREEFRSLRKRLKMFPEKSARMEPKFDRLRQLEEEGVFLTTLWDIGERADYAGKGGFHGNCPPQVVENCVLLKTKKGELIVDPMAGSGTALDVCKLLGRNCIAYDIKPPKSRNDIIRNDSRKIPLENNSADMVFLHPPYWDMVYYTSVDEGLPDLSRTETLDEYLSMLGQVLRECYRILKSEKYLCILLGDRIKNGRFIPLCRKAANLAEEIGFTDCGYAIKFTKGSTSLVVKGKTIYAELAYTGNLPKINHDLVMFLKKGKNR